MCRINSRELNQNFRLICFFFWCMCALKIKQTNLIFDPEKNYFEPVSELQKKKKM